MRNLQRDVVTAATLGEEAPGFVTHVPADLGAAVAPKVDDFLGGELSRRLDGALRVFRSEDGLLIGMTPTAKEMLLGIAHVMVESYSFDNKTGRSTFTVPAGLTEFEVMRALNVYFREHLPRFNTDAIYEGDLHWYEKLPKKYPDYCLQRDYSCALQISIQGVVKGTNGKNRSTQGAMLKAESLMFSDPRYLAIAAALHACKHEGADLLKDVWVRGSVPGIALHTERFLGVLVFRCYADNDRISTAASGSSYPELK